MIAAVVFWSSVALIAWVYAGYPMCLVALGRLRPRARHRAELELPVSVIIAAHNEEGMIDRTLRSVRSSSYPAELLQIVVASDGSDDQTVAVARSSGATEVIDLPRVGKLHALNAAASHSSGEILVFADADTELLEDSLSELVSNFADPEVGGVAANELHVASAGAAVARGEGLYWRYEQKLKELEDRVGSTVSASGRFYAIRRDLFTPATNTYGTDDFVVSTEVIRAGRRLAFDGRARVVVGSPEEGATELRRKVRMMNRGMRAALELANTLSPKRRAAYLVQLYTHKILRRLVVFFLIAAFVSSLYGAATRGGAWWMVLVPQLLFYGLAVSGAIAQMRKRQVSKMRWVPFYFCLSNIAAGLAVVSLVRGVRYHLWDPSLARSTPADAEATP